MSEEPSRDCQGYPPLYLQEEPQKEINFYLPVPPRANQGENENENQQHHLACSWITSPISSDNGESNTARNNGHNLCCCSTKKKSNRKTEKNTNKNESIIHKIHPDLNKIDHSANIIIVCHGLLSWRNQMLIANLANNLSNELDCHTIRFDFSGNGHSSGEWSYGSCYDTDYNDLCSIYNFVKDVMGCNVHCIIGHSQGSAAVLRHAAMIDTTNKHNNQNEDGNGNENGNIRGSSMSSTTTMYVNLAGRCSIPTTDFKPESKFTKSQCQELETNGQFSFPTKGNREIVITTQSIQDRYSYDSRPFVSNIKQANVLTIHGDKDTTVPLENVQLFDDLILNHTKKIISGADHNFNGLRHLNEIVSTICDFLQ